MARRKLRKTRISVGLKLIKIWPIFKWKICQVCDDAIRREWVWRYDEKPGFFNEWNSYICFKCCPTIDNAAKHLGITIYEMK